MKNKLKIIIADDQVLYRKWLKLLLRNLESVEISGEAQNGEEAVNRAISTNPDLVILDYEMPVMNGIDAAAKIHKELPHTIIMMLTVYKDSVLQRKAKLAGVQTFLAKDVDENEILEIVIKLAKEIGCNQC